MAGYHDNNSKVSGLWKIIECVSLSGCSEADGIEGTEFLLNENGDVEWKIKGDCPNLPLFECSMFEVYTYQNIQCYVKRTLLRFAASAKGYVIEFRLDQPVMSEDLMLLTYDGWFMLQCEKSALPSPENVLPFSLLPALQDEYFADISLLSISGKRVSCHSIVLNAMLPSQKSTKEINALFENIDDNGVAILLHYLYTDALPHNLSFSDAKYCITATKNIKDLEPFRVKCCQYARNLHSRNKIIKLVNEVHVNLKAIAQIVSSVQQHISSPSSMIRKLKEALIPFAIGLVKVLETCQEFEVMCSFLTNKEQREVIRYFRLHAPVVLQETTDILKKVKGVLNLFSYSSRMEFSEEFVPEVLNALHLVVIDVATIRNCLEQVIQASSFTNEFTHSQPISHSLVKSLENELYLRELQKLRILQENLSSMTNSLLIKSEHFEEVEVHLRNRGMARMLELFEMESVDIILQLEALVNSLDEVFDWSEFKFVFKGGTSKLHRIMSKLASDSTIVDQFITPLVEMVDHPEFTATVLKLGFTPKKDESQRSSLSSSSLSEELMIFFQSSKDSTLNSAEKPETTNAEICDIDAINPNQTSSSQKTSCVVKDVKENYNNLEDLQDIPLEESLVAETQKINLTQRMCEIPNASKSRLAQSLFSMMKSNQMVDLTFCIIPPQEDDSVSSDSSIDLSERYVSIGLDATTEAKKTQEKQECSIQQSDSTENTCKDKNIMEGFSYVAVAKLIDIEEEPTMLSQEPTMLSQEPTILSQEKNVLSKDSKKVPLENQTLDEIFNTLSSSSKHLTSSRKFKKSQSLDPGTFTTDSSQEEKEPCKLTSQRKSKVIPKQSFSLDVDPSEGGEVYDFQCAKKELSSLKINPQETVEVASKPNGGIELHAHRVVIATQCDWFKRALLSGMKEAIDRYIEVPGCSENIFNMFLTYLYTGEVNAISLATDQLVDFLVLVDHYGVDHLKALVEQHLETRVDDETAVPLLMVAYHFNISKLKELCLHHCAMAKRYELLHQVPPDLRQQLVATILSLKKWNAHEMATDIMDDSAFRSDFSQRRIDCGTISALIDEELSGLLCNMQDSASSSDSEDASPGTE